MNNSDILGALSIGLIAVIYLFQADPGLLRIKIRRWEIWPFCGLWALIILSVNHEVLDRSHLTFYFTVGSFYLTPNEWAMIIFLSLFVFICVRVFTPRIFNRNRSVLLHLVKKYRSEKKVKKLEEILTLMMHMPDFAERFGEDLDDLIFNDHHLIEEFCSDYPEVIIRFTELYPAAEINKGDYLYYILKGLFSDPGNQIYAEIRRYRKEDIKEVFLNQWPYGVDEVKFEDEKSYATPQRIIGWLARVLSFPTHLKEDVQYFLNEYAMNAKSNNDRILSRGEIETTLSRDPIYNAIQLFRIVLIEVSINRKDFNKIISRYTVMFYSAWDFVLSHTDPPDGDVQLNNDAFTVNEYLLKYIYEGYCSLFVLNLMRPTAVSKNNSPVWAIQQLVMKLNRLWKNGKVSIDSKQYFMEGLIDLYYELPCYLPPDKVRVAGPMILYQLKANTLGNTPFGDPEANRRIFQEICRTYDFLEKNDSRGNEQRGEEFYTYFLPYTEEWKYRICDT
jgi:hypothetical protein